MKRAARGYTRLNAFAEEMPVIDNRIELASDKDEFGMPLGKIIHSFSDETVALFNANFDKGLEIAKATGAKEVWPNKGPMPTIHLMGGTIMGKTARDSVTDNFGQTHETIYGSPGQGFSRTAVHPIRLIQFSRCRCAAWNSWRKIGAAWRARRSLPL